MRYALRVIIFLIVISLYNFASVNFSEALPINSMEEVRSVDITIVYDNVPFDKNFLTGFGFACLLEVKNSDGEHCILFDTGGNFSKLNANIKRTGHTIEDIELVVISHNHFDHTGGLSGLEYQNPDIKVFLPKSAPINNMLNTEVIKKAIQIGSEPYEIVEGVYSTGCLGTTIKEQSLIVFTKKGIVVVTGCAHPGIVNIVKHVKDTFSQEIYLVLGGFHRPPVRAAKELDTQGVKNVAPSHCTGDQGTKALQDVFQDRFIVSGIGKHFSIP